MSVNKTYYLYRHIRLDKNIPFYIGIGTMNNKKSLCKTTYYRAHSFKQRNNFWKHIVNKTEFRVEILFETDDFNIIKEKEKEFINLYGRKDLGLGTLVNLTDGGEGCNPSSERLYQMSQIMKDKYKNGMAHWAAGKKFTEEHKKNLSIAQKNLIKEGYQNPILNKVNIYKRTIGEFKHSIETRKIRSKPILQFNLNGEFIAEYFNATEASEKTNSIRSLICRTCLGKTKTHNGFVWKYKF